jgi:hypothetical protein
MRLRLMCADIDTDLLPVPVALHALGASLQHGSLY